MTQLRHTRRRPPDLRVIYDARVRTERVVRGVGAGLAITTTTAFPAAAAVQTNNCLVMLDSHVCMCWRCDCCWRCVCAWSQAVVLTHVPKLRQYANWSALIVAAMGITGCCLLPYQEYVRSTRYPAPARVVAHTQHAMLQYWTLRTVGGSGCGVW